MSEVAFGQWLGAVNRVIASKTFGMLDSQDLVDIDYMSLYEDGTAPAEAAAEALRESGAGLEVFLQ